MPSADTDPAFLPAHALSAEFDARRLSPIDLVDVLLARIRAQDQKLHAFVEVYADEARLAAEAADKAIRSGHRIGPLHGIPIALKDLIEIEGRVTTGGSQVWRDRRSTYTATIAQRLIAAGMIVIGKTHTVEFAMGGWGTNQHRGTPWNPWDPAFARTPGGDQAAAPGWRWPPEWRLGELAPIPGVRCGCQRRGADSAALRPRSAGLAPMGFCR